MSLVYVEPELLVALDKKVLFVNPDDLQIFKEVDLPADLTQCGLPPPSNADTSPPPADAAPPAVQSVALSPDRQLLAIATAGGQKAVLLYACRPEHAKLLSARPLSRASSALTFSHDSKALIVVDKSGDCYQYDCEDVHTPPKLLLGHLSIVYAVLLTADARFVVTCDRDDKIRITNYPHTYDIHNYCLGHGEFVAGMALLPANGLVSVSGDKTLRIWDYDSGKQVAMAELPAPGIRLTLRQTDSGRFEAAVLLYQPEESVAIYELHRIDEGCWTVTETALLSVPTDVTPQHLCFAKNRLYLTGVTKDNHFAIKVVERSNAPAAPDNWTSMVEEQFSGVAWKPEDFDAWFKKKYDNVSEYLERKKRRMEEKRKS